ncbi:hypothetical protein [Paractinoplanes durhamensis]|uniref:hypothetical protein n=1 Tax=Paractinoplanes durhamensis TaxID=113563 RepID=UPI00362FE9A7
MTNTAVEDPSYFGTKPSRDLAEKHHRTQLKASRKAACHTETPLRFVRLMCGTSRAGP